MISITTNIRYVGLIPQIALTAEGVKHTMKHWFMSCPATLTAKMEIFEAEEDLGLHLLTKEPKKSLALARRTLLGAGRQ